VEIKHALFPHCIICHRWICGSVSGGGAGGGWCYSSFSSSSRSCQMVVHAAHFLGSPRGEKAQLFRAYLKTENPTKLHKCWEKSSNA